MWIAHINDNHFAVTRRQYDLFVAAIERDMISVTGTVEPQIGKGLAVPGIPPPSLTPLATIQVVSVVATRKVATNR